MTSKSYFQLQRMIQLQSNKFVNFYAETRNQYEPLNSDDFSDFLQNEAQQDVHSVLTTPSQVADVISSLNKRSACIQSDIPMKIFSFFGDEISKPLCNILNSIFLNGRYPEMWKTEYITPVPKQFPAEKISDFRPISVLLNGAKVADKIMASYITQDMSRDKKQYGNEKGLSINHYLIKMLHKILLSVDKNSITDKKAVILTMLDYSIAFERQSHF